MKKIKAATAIKALIEYYKNALEDDGDFIASQLEKEFCGIITKVEHNMNNDCINFEVANEESYKLYSQLQGVEDESDK